MSKQVRTGLAALGLLLSAMSAAHAAPVTYTAILNGSNESPPNSTPGFGATSVIFDDIAHSLKVNVAFVGLSAGTTASHIHCCTAASGAGTAGIATETPTFSNLPLGVKTGAFTQTYNTSLASSWNPTFLSSNGGTAAGAEAAFNAGLAAGDAYLNIHTTAYPGGEVRAFLKPVPAVPEPDNYAMLLAGVPLLLWLRRRRA